MAERIPVIAAGVRVAGETVAQLRVFDVLSDGDAAMVRHQVAEAVRGAGAGLLPGVYRLVLHPVDAAGVPVGPTGREPELLQDCDRKLSRALASTPDARLHAREAAAAYGVKGRALPPMPWAAVDPVPDDSIPLARPRTAGVTACAGQTFPPGWGAQ